MARINVTFDFATVYDVSKIDVKAGQKFSLELTDYVGPTKWFMDNDPVLDLETVGNIATVSAKEKGISTILIMDQTRLIIKEFVITILEDVSLPAVKFEIESEPPISK